MKSFLLWLIFLFVVVALTGIGLLFLPLLLIKGLFLRTVLTLVFVLIFVGILVRIIILLWEKMI